MTSSVACRGFPILWCRSIDRPKFAQSDTKDTTLTHTVIYSVVKSRLNCEKCISLAIIFLSGPLRIQGKKHMQATVVGTRRVRQLRVALASLSTLTGHTGPASSIFRSWWSQMVTVLEMIMMSHSIVSRLLSKSCSSIAKVSWMEISSVAQCLCANWSVLD
jgi:hypothetical protein